MGRMIDDSVKQKLLDSLAEEPTMVLSTAYAYAKNYVLYGEDITKAWTTAVQQASIIEKVSLNAWAQAHETFRKEYETSLKADLVAMLTELKTEIIELWDSRYDVWLDNQYYIGKSDTLEEVDEVIQQKIDKLEENKGNE